MMRNVSRCVVLFTLWFSCSSARDAIQIENHNQSCVTHHLSIVPGSSVLLPCNFTYNPHNVVSWIHVPTVSVVTITSGGQVKFGDPRFGRIHTFPNQGSRGNFSISISRVNFTDLGSYQCLMQDQCVQVELALKTESVVWLSPFYMYIICGVSAFVVLSVGCFLCVYYIFKEKRTTEENGYENQVDDVLVTGREPGDGQPQDADSPRSPAYMNQIVYENNDYIVDEPDYLNQLPRHSGLNGDEASPNSDGPFERVMSQKSKQKFHSELLNRLRQASLRKHHYVNQEELRTQQKTRSTKGARKKKTHPQYPNPIYNGSSNALDQM
ncbi:unnamed protein product [Knipowitschia caucasica]